ncbi:CHC2 zinc finger domain-containing protein [Thermodesulfobacteriota bacterium]
MIAELKEGIDFISVVEGAGVELKQRGNRYVGPCPFHTEKTPSFFIFNDNRFKCFGCGESGDCIDFIRKLHGLSFQDALKHLGIEQSPITPKIKQDIKERKRKAEQVRKFREWEIQYCIYVSDLLHRTKKLMMNGIPPEDLDLYATLFHQLPIWEHSIRVLVHGTDKEKFKLFKEAHKNGEFRISK